METGEAAQEPSQVTVTVFSARKLQSRKKGDVCQASVVFGVGKDYYKTETVESNSPQWNQEARINVSGRVRVIKFKVRDREHTLGVVNIDMAELTNYSCERWLPLQPHRKSQEAHGELLVDCYVSEYRPVSTSEKASPETSRTSSVEDLRGHKPLKEKFSFHGRTPSWTRTKEPKSERHSVHESSPFQERRAVGGRISSTSSDYELHSKRRVLPYQSRSDTNLRSPSPEPLTVSSDHVNTGDDGSSLGEDSLVPEISGISPNEGSVEGGQRVILRGSNLGESKNDVVRVEIVDVDCTDSLEYFSPSKLIVTTLSRPTPGSGPVVVETLKGGVGVSSITFTFVGTEAGQVPGTGYSLVGGLRSTVENYSPFVLKKKGKAAETEELQTEVKALKQQVRDLKDVNVQLREENQSLKDYIDRLLLEIMDQTPEILEVKSSPSLRSVRGSRSSDANSFVQ